MDRYTRELHSELANATDYRGWYEAAVELDRRDGCSEWKEDDTSHDYDWRLIRSRLRQIRQYRQDGAWVKLIHHLRQGLHWNLGNTGNPALYAHCRIGTKHLIHEYITEVASALNQICDTELAELPQGAKLKFFREVEQSYGNSALMLSGGATLGMFHLGVVKALHEQNLLPRVISGSSAGSLMAGTIGTHTDAELSGIFEPGGFDITAFQRVALRQLVKGQSLMDPAQLRRCLAVNVGDETFLEAFERTRRIIGVTISPADPHHQGRLMNYLTSPHVLIHRAVMASCAVPGVFPPVMLEARDYENNVVPYMPSKRWIDGTLSNDLPMLRVARLHNVNHYIVSQTNPHIVPFVTESVSNEQKRGWAPLSKELLVNGSRGAMTLARKHLDPYGSGRVINKIDDIMRQRYSGDINIIPRHTPHHLLKLFANLTQEDLQNYIREGEQATWPRIERIRYQTRISRTLEDCLLLLKQRVLERAQPKISRLRARA